MSVRIHYSWLAVVGVVAWTVAQGYLPDRYPGWSVATYWAVGATAALLLFASVLIHELAHSVVARARGFEVDGITLFLFGGVSRVRSESKTARDELVITLAGPMSSLLMGAALWGLASLVPSGPESAAAVLEMLWFSNIVLAAFNLLPLYPLDGGRTLRAVVWGLSGSLQKVTGVATRVGEAGGLGLAGLGAILLFRGDWWGALGLASVGLFLHMTASSSRREA